MLILPRSRKLNSSRSDHLREFRLRFRRELFHHSLYLLAIGAGAGLLLYLTDNLLLELTAALIAILSIIRAVECLYFLHTTKE